MDLFIRILRINAQSYGLPCLDRRRPRTSEAPVFNAVDSTQYMWVGYKESNLYLFDIWFDRRDGVRKTMVAKLPTPAGGLRHILSSING
jgi:hypothetical protein